ncbi:hypothetical protein B0H19DRAFT_682679 [Mycena capillaripes]|nr:hypothetical protein B0H19DRAFT_682679 [Mycena capillaripes]
MFIGFAYKEPTQNFRRFAWVLWQLSIVQFRLGPKSRNSPTPDQQALENLISITRNLVQGTVWYVSAMAQRASAMEKINASVEVGMKRYWLSLGSSTELLGLKLEMCMKLLHYDITASWNFDDDNVFFYPPPT